MKLKTILTFFLLTHTLVGFSQTGINYQAIARDAQGQEMVNTSFTIKFSILLNSVSGTLEWQETQSARTNEFGLFTLVIGNGDWVAGSATLDQINWGVGTHFLKVEAEFAQGQGYTTIGTTQMTAVPYALYAGKSGNSGSGGITSITYEPNTYKIFANGTEVADISNTIQDLSLNENNTLSLSKSTGTIDLSKYIDKPTLSLSANFLSISNGNTLLLPHPYLLLESNKLSLRQDTATYGSYKIDTDSTNEIQDLSYSGKYIRLTKSNKTVYDADTSATNELITNATFDGDNLKITEAGTTHTVDLTSLKKAPWVGFSYNVANFTFATTTIPQEIPFNDKIYDNASAFNSTKFTAPQAGAYFFSLNLSYSAGSPITINILKNGTSCKAYTLTTQSTLSITFILDLFANDMISLQETNAYSGENVILYNGSFTGYQVH